MAVSLVCEGNCLEFINIWKTYQGGKKMENTVTYSKLVLMEFGAEWCEPCQMFKGELNEFGEEAEGLVTIIHVDIDKEEELTARMGITSVPTLVLVDQGNVVTQASGFMPKRALHELVDRYL